MTLDTASEAYYIDFMMTNAASTETVTRHVGFCALCERDIKLNVGKLVHHGYQRPGDGYIHGDCPLVHAAPYEVTADTLVPHVAYWMDEAKRAGKRAADLKAGRITTLERVEVRGFGRMTKREVVVVDKSKVHLLEWSEALRMAVYAAEQRKETALREAERLKKWIAGWATRAFKAPRTVEEMANAEKAVRDAAKAERAAAKAAREAKKAATAAKQQALADRRQAAQVAIVEATRTLAARVEAGETLTALAKEIDKLAAAYRREKWLSIFVLGEAVHKDLATLKLGDFQRGWFEVSPRLY
jgi:hypothetical protein